MKEYDRRRLAVLCGQPDEEYQKQFIEGFEKQAFDADCDVCVFAMYQKFQETKVREIGESTIFDLVNESLFDGIIVLGDSIQTPGVLDFIDTKLHDNAKCPVLFVDSDSKYFKSIKLNHYDAIVMLMEHLIDDHKYKDIAFITGKQWHPHSRQRLSAYIDTMKKYDLPIKENRVFYGDFWYNSGFDIANDFINNNWELPEAFACANDYMAIGLAEAFTSHGIKVPEDIAIVGYDSVEQGRTSPSPITSIPLPVNQFGIYAASTILNIIDGNPVPGFTPEYDFFHGGSCGCHCESCVPKVMLRDKWRTDLFARSFYSVDNRLVEDMYAKEDLTSALEVVESYLDYLGEFDSFHLCLNQAWGEGGVEYKRVDYTDKMYEIMTCLNGGKDNEISFYKPFMREDILPCLHEHCDTPRAFLFTPVHFDSACFGFAALSYGDRVVGMDVSYMFWLRYIMLGIEALRRQTVFVNTKHTMDEIRFTDPLTGLNNYDGLVENTMKLTSLQFEGPVITILAVDIVGLGSINEASGRKNGDKIIRDFSRIVKNCCASGSICGRLGNDEFVIIRNEEEHADEYIDKTIKALSQSLGVYNERNGTHIEFTSGYSTERVRTSDDIERLINEAVSEKNGNKMNERRNHPVAGTTEDETVMLHRVKDLLDNNKFEYHFQPIVDTKDGSIFAYEALMRPVCDYQITPLEVIEYSSKLGRLEEIETYTFLNILSIVKEDMKRFEGKKVFINSLPGITVNENDRIVIRNLLTALSDTVVIELTERSELDDETLNKLKEEYSRLGIQSAVDDYGTGYSNVVNLLRYMPDYVKIDRMLLSGIEENPQKQHFVKDIVKFAHENNFKVLSEGVETSSELETCILLGTDYIQGFYTARPSKEVITELPAPIREEIYRYWFKAHSDRKAAE